MSTSNLVPIGWSPSCAPTSLKYKLECLGAKLQLCALRLSDHGSACQGCRGPGYGRSFSRAPASPDQWQRGSLRSGSAPCHQMPLHALPHMCMNGGRSGLDGGPEWPGEARSGLDDWTCVRRSTGLNLSVRRNYAWDAHLDASDSVGPPSHRLVGLTV